MASVGRTVTLPLAFVVCVLVVAGLAATPGVAVGESLGAAAAPQDSSVVEASLALDRSTRRLIQQGLRNEGFDPGYAGRSVRPADARCDSGVAAVAGSVTDGVPEQRRRGVSSTGRRTGADGAGSSPPPPDRSRRRRERLVGTRFHVGGDSNSNPAPATATTGEVDPQNAAETNTQQRTCAGSDGTVQLPPEILVVRHFVRVERLLGDGNPAAALEEMNEILALQQEHDLVLQDGFDFEYPQVTYTPGRTETAIASATEYLAAGGREGEFYREAGGGAVVGSAGRYES